jgi:hypothetical protein
VLDQVVSKALAKNPARRYQQARAFQENLNSIINSGDIDDIPPAIFDRRKKKPKRKIAIVSSLAVATLLVIGLCVAISLSSSVDNPSGKNDPTATKTQKTDAKGDVSVPDVKGVTQDRAKEILTSNGFKVGSVTTEDNPTILKDYVTKTDPKVGTMIKRGSTVNIFVSSGMVKLPNLVGKDSLEATKILKELNLVVSYKNEESSEPEGRVLAQFPAEGSVQQQSTVSLTLAVSVKVLMPSLTGMTLEQAQQSLDAIGLRSSVTYKPSSTIPRGSVISQDPAPGTSLPKGAEVSLVVSQ